MAKILLLNFTESEANIISKAGYSVERGFLGSYQPQRYWPFQTPHPIYEYDILIYTSWFTSEVLSEFKHLKNLLAEEGSLDALNDSTSAPTFRISFIGDNAGLPGLLHGGLGFIKVSKADPNVSIFIETDVETDRFAIPEMHRLVSDFKGEIEKVGQFVSVNDSEIHPSCRHFPVLTTRNGEQVAAYGTMFEDEPIPNYIILPQLKCNSKAVVGILERLERLSPQLFPEKNKYSWLDSDEFALPEEKVIDREIEKKLAETLVVVERLREERQKLHAENAFIRQLLVATEDPKVEKNQRLSSVVTRSLEFLGFSVQDIDQKTKSAIKKEDFWVSDADFFAITEVTGTVNTNPKVMEFNGILGRLATIYKRQTDLIPDGVSEVTGLLVLNYDCERHPNKRPKAYTGELAAIVESAEEHSIGLLSTVELHKILVAVKKGILSKEEARSILKKTGRIEYDPQA